MKLERLFDFETLCMVGVLGVAELTRLREKVSEKSEHRPNSDSEQECRRIGRDSLVKTQDRNGSNNKHHNEAGEQQHTARCPSCGDLISFDLLLNNGDSRPSK